MYKYILMDLDNTLLDFNAAQIEAIRHVIASENLVMTDEIFNQYHLYNKGLWEQLEQGTITKPQLFKQRFEMLFGLYDRTVDGMEKEAVFRESLNHDSTLMEGAVEILEYLKNKRYILATASNGVLETQLMRMNGSNIYHYFDYHFISDEVGVEKPDEQFYQHCLKTMNVQNKKEVLMIGDGIKPDIIGARNAGIDACYFGKEEVMEAKYHIKQLEELKNIL